MNDRERLIEMTSDAFDKWDIYVDSCLQNGENPERTVEQVIADYLLANGVIVPPVKVGDVVWNIDLEEVEPAKVSSIEINREYSRFYALFPDTSEYLSRIFRDSEIGKTVFLSREEAEKALEERSKG